MNLALSKSFPGIPLSTPLLTNRLVEMQASLAAPVLAVGPSFSWGGLHWSSAGAGVLPIDASSE